MVFGGESYSAPEQSVMWDLRQFYVEWTRAYMSSFSQSHLVNDYPEMLSKLKRWHTIIWGRSIKDFKDDKIKDEKFEWLTNKIIELSNNREYINTYFLKERNPEAVAAFDEAFDSIIVYVIWLMKKNKLFGSDTINRGLT